MRLRPAVALILWALAACSFVVTPGFGASRTAIDSKVGRIGGLSGIEVTDDGAGFVAISDAGYVVRGTISRSGGRLTGAVVTELIPLRDKIGKALDRGKGRGDAEGLAMEPSGRLHVSFEGMNRVLAYDSGEKGLLHPPLPRVPGLGSNTGFEALAVDDQRRLVTVQEDSPDGAPAPILRLERGRWREVATLVRSGGFRPTGADFGPDGALYLLEREVRTLGFRSRIRRIDLSDGGTVEGTVVWAPPVTWGNLEGLSVWTDGEGQMRMTMVADDNFLSVLLGGLVEIVLDNSGRGL